jgi:diacylglycerol kinase (ATP)
MTPDTLIIMNNAAARTRREWPSIENALKTAGITYEIHRTSVAGEATNTAREALKNGFRVIAVVGGDGTISETVEGFFQFDSADNSLPKPINRNAVLALLPAGTGNDLARGIGGERSTTE